MNPTDFESSKAGTLTVALPHDTPSDRQDEIANVIGQALTSEAAGQFAWHQPGKHHNEMVFHVFGDNAALIARAELDRLGYDRRALVMTDWPIVAH